MVDLEKQPWWNYLDRVQQDLIRQSLYLIEDEEKKSRALSDYSFVVFPAAKAYEGFLKKLFFDLGLIDRNQFSGERFRIGRALNPAIFKEYPQESVYEKLNRFCGGEAIPEKLWKTWKTSRNLVFHFFPEKGNLVIFPEAKKRVEEIVDAISFSFQGCQASKRNKSLLTKTSSSILLLFGLVFFFWSIFRFSVHFSVFTEETVFKPLFWLLPTFLVVKFVEKRRFWSSLGFSGKNFENSLTIVGVFLAFFVFEMFGFGLLRYQTSLVGQVAALPFSSLNSLFLILVTALVEETFFRGFLFNRLWEVYGQPVKANLVTSLGFLLLHLPVSLFVYHFSWSQLAISFVLLFLMSLGSGLLFASTYNIIPSVLWHFLWNWQIFLGT